MRRPLVFSRGGHLGLVFHALQTTGSFSLKAADFAANGRHISALGIPTLVVQEGGYRVRALGANARGFFSGLLGYSGEDPKPQVKLSKTNSPSKNAALQKK